MSRVSFIIIIFTLLTILDPLKSEENYNKAEIIVAKQRHGPIGSIKMHFDANFTKFSDLSSEEYDSISE